MRISLRQIKDVFKAVRNIDIVKDENGKIGIDTILEIMDDAVINDVCEIITGEKKDYTEDILDENGAIEIIGDFFLVIISKLEKSNAIKSLLERLLGMNLDGLLKTMKPKKKKKPS